MTIWSDLESDFRGWINTNGVPIDIQNQKQTFAAGSYDEGAWTSSGTKQSGSAFFMPITMRTGGHEAQMLAQGLITLTDMKAYIPSGLEVKEGAKVVIDSGSWDLLGIKSVPDETHVVYQKLFLRTLV